MRTSSKRASRVQAFRFALDPTEEQVWALARHFGARRKAYNWTVAIRIERAPPQVPYAAA